jgi:uncharacterized membrane protein
MSPIKGLYNEFMRASVQTKLSVLFSVIGLLISAYLWYEFVGPKSVVCPINAFNANCSEVLDSPNSLIFGVHMSVYGVGFFCLALIFLLQKLIIKHKAIDYMLVTLSCFGLAFTMMLRIVELVVIGSWCPWCWLVFAATIGLFIVAFKEAMRVRRLK